MNKRVSNGCMGVFVVALLAWGATADDVPQPRSSEHDVAARHVNPMSWPNFRGANGLGRSSPANPPRTWNAEEDTGVLWKIRLPKFGMSSPIVWETRVFLTGADEHSRQLYCIDGDTGNCLWKYEVTGVPGSSDDGKIPEVLEEAGYAAPTPTTNGKCVAAVFATGELVGVDLDGNRAWLKHLGIPNNHYGHTSSLLCHANLLFVQYDQKENAKLLAFEMNSGKLVWQVKREFVSWSSPILAEYQGRKQLVLTDSKAVEGYDPATGKSLWRVECLDGEVASSAAYANGIVVVANEGAPASAIDITGESPRILWRWDEALPDSASPVANDKWVVVPTAFGVVSCLEVKSGKMLWEHEFDQGFSSSPILVGEHIYAVDLSGNVQIFKMDGRFELVGRAVVGEPVYATPAFVGDRIYVRSLDHLFCIQEADPD